VRPLLSDKAQYSIIHATTSGVGVDYEQIMPPSIFEARSPALVALVKVVTGKRLLPFNKAMN
jgi:hypothetical protein